MKCRQTCKHKNQHVHEMWMIKKNSHEGTPRKNLYTPFADTPPKLRYRFSLWGVPTQNQGSPSGGKLWNPHKSPPTAGKPVCRFFIKQPSEGRFWECRSLPTCQFGGCHFWERQWGYSLPYCHFFWHVCKAFTAIFFDMSVKPLQTLFANVSVKPLQTCVRFYVSKAFTAIIFDMSVKPLQTCYLRCQ